MTSPVQSYNGIYGQFILGTVQKTLLGEEGFEGGRFGQIIIIKITLNCSSKTIKHIKGCY